MRALVLAVAFVLAGLVFDPRATPDKLPGVGTFTYSGTPIMTSSLTRTAAR